MSNESKETILSKATPGEFAFIKNLKLPRPTDERGIRALGVDFVNAFSAVRFSSLFNNNPRSLYSVAGYVQGRGIKEVLPKPKKKKVRKKVKRKKKVTKKKAVKKAGKKTRTRPEPYIGPEILWMNDYPIPKGGWSPKAMKKLANDHHKKFPDRSKRTPQAITWKLMNLRGAWNPDRGAGKKVKKKTTKKKIRKTARKRTTKRKARKSKVTKKHYFTREEENIILPLIPKRRRFRKGEINSIRAVLYSKLGTVVSYTSLRIKCNRLRKKWKKMTTVEKRTILAAGKKAEKKSAEDVKKKATRREIISPNRYRYTAEQDAFLLLEVAKNIQGFAHKKLGGLCKRFNKKYIVNLTSRAIQVKCGRLRRMLNLLSPLQLENVVNDAKVLVAASSKPKAEKLGGLEQILKKATTSKASTHGIVVDNHIVWTGDHRPVKEQISVFSGVIEGVSACILVVEGVILEKIFTESRPEPQVIEFK